MGRNLAIDILHLFNLENFILKEDKSKDFSYNDETSAVRDTILLKLNDKTLNEINNMFTETDSNGNRFNALELLFNAEMTPPMVSPPLDRPSNLIDLYKIEPSNPNQGGYLHPQMQRKYPVISNNRNEDEHNFIRIEPSEDAIDALNNLQQTEWRVNENILPIVKETLKQYIRQNIEKCFEIRETTGKKLFYSVQKK